VCGRHGCDLDRLREWPWDGRAASGAVECGWEAVLDRDGGSLYQHYPGFEEMIREALRCLFGDEIEKQIEMGFTKDGSGVGAALSALQTTKHDKS